MENSSSPQWSSTTKTIIAITLIATIAGLLIKFQSIVPLLLMAFILVYLLYPVASFLNHHLRLSWGLSVGALYVVLVLTIVGLLTLAGLELAYQFRSLITFIQNSLNHIPALADTISKQVFTIGPFRFEMANLDLGTLSGQLIDTLRPMLGQTGQVIGVVAGGALNVVGSSAFVLLISYFLLVESRGLREGILHINLPGYSDDLHQLSLGLAHIWNAFLRGQIIVIALASFVYSIVLSTLGVNYALGLALLAGSARFLPYIGSLISWTTLALVTFFQPHTPFGLAPQTYTLIVLILAWAIDGMIDNFVSPRIMADALKVHPAAVLVAAIIALDLLGILGVIIAAPILATIQLIVRYIVRKLFDLDPWEGMQAISAPPPLRQQVREWYDKLRTKLRPKESVK